jgi:uncharacterized protein with HEPN domain
MKQQRVDIDFLIDIDKACSQASAFVLGFSFEAFCADEKTQFAVVRALEIIGEAAKRVTEATRDRHPQVPWRSMCGIRDKLIHDYVSVNQEIVWKTVAEDLPGLRLAIQRIIEESKS